MGMSTPDRKTLPPQLSPEHNSRPRPQTRASTLPASGTVAAAREIGGPCGPEPTRFGDWERNGRCIDF
jgi:hypothetical protein